MYNKQFMDCYVDFDGQTLKVGNDRVERKWNLTGGTPAVVSLRNKRTGKEWLVEECDIAALFEKNKAFGKAGVSSGELKFSKVNAEVFDDLGVAQECLQAEIELKSAHALIRWVHQIYPGQPILRSHLWCEAEKLDCEVVLNNTEAEFENLEIASKGTSNVEDYLDYLPLEPNHCRWRSIRFNDVTDHHNNLIKMDEGLFYPKEKNNLQGNLLFIQDLIGKEGLTVIKEGPTPLAYQGGNSRDFHINGNKIYSCGWGVSLEEISSFPSISTYGSTILVWEDGEENALLALQDYHRAIHRFIPSKDAFVMSNTWGDRSKDGRVCEEFIVKELEVAQRLGITFCQIDDGWQGGVTANSVVAGGVWEGYYKNNPDFWQPHKERFPNGLEPVSKSAKEKNITLGLWFSPDSTDNFGNWEKDALTLIDLHRKHGVIAFKLDGIKLRSKKGEENLFNMMQKVVAETEGKVFFNLDVTAEVRNGYYGRIQYANLFLENRYTDWHNYYPHWTLRNLWMLSKYYPTFRLQAEFLNVTRNKPIYEGDPLSPANCGLDYALAVTMCANPLAWMELSGLEEDQLVLLEKNIKTYRRIQPDFLSGYVLPIGEKPSGTSWTGFQSITGDKTGFILILREYNDQPSKQVKLWNLKNITLQLECILGMGDHTSLQVNKEGECRFELGTRFGYSLYRYKAE